MVLYSKESLELLRQRIDLPEVLGQHVELKRAGAAFKALCPFHEEKTPSFVVQRGDTHYHCFGCGAHGDAIAFLMSHLRMGFTEAVESLAERFQVTLERVDDPEAHKGPSKPKLKAALEHAAQLYHYLLQHSEEGHQALEYLYKRGIDLEFIRRFQVGYAPKQGDVLVRYLREQQIDDEVVQQAGLCYEQSSGRRRDFFAERIAFPIRDAMGAVIGFSARKMREETFGGKYINTPETPLFKKSRVLFGLSYSRARIAKEKQAIIVEGQIDALRLIHTGFDYTVAGQGTAFGEEHVKELLQLGVAKVFLALDGDTAGRDAAVKIGNLFQKKGVDVRVVAFPDKCDPDAVLLKEGPEALSGYFERAEGYLPFLFRYLSSKGDPRSPSGKSEIVEEIAETIRNWEHPVMIHESLRLLAELAQVPESTIGVGMLSLPDFMIKKSDRLGLQAVDPDRILEGDVLRWLVLAASQSALLFPLARANIRPEHFRSELARKLFHELMRCYEAEHKVDLLALGAFMEGEEEEKLLKEIMQRKINIPRAEIGFKETLQKLLIRHWMEQREEIRQKIQSTALSDEEALELAKQFDELKKSPPQLVIP